MAKKICGPGHFCRMAMLNPVTEVFEDHQPKSGQLMINYTEKMDLRIDTVAGRYWVYHEWHFGTE